MLANFCLAKSIKTTVMGSTDLEPYFFQPRERLVSSRYRSSKEFLHAVHMMTLLNLQKRFPHPVQLVLTNSTKG